MTATDERQTLLARAPSWRPEIALAIYTIGNDRPPPAAPVHLGKYEVMRMVAAETGVSEIDIAGPSRTDRVVIARQLFMVLARKFTGCSTVDIGRFVSRDHTCVLHACEKVKEAPERYEPHFWNLLAKIEKRVGERS